MIDNVAARPQTSSAYTPPATQPSTSARITSLDIARGVVMILMAIDHVRVYSGVPAGGPTPGVFFTRWITHFVAPGFVFFAGTSIFLHGLKLGDKKALSRFLLTRGAWLVLLELTVIRIAWTFNYDFSHYLLAGVIWMLGWCMIIMAALVHLPLKMNAIVGVSIIALHNLLGIATGGNDSLGSGAVSVLWHFLYGGGVVQIGQGGPALFILYVIVPWIGVMMAGYAFGAVMQLPANRRRGVILRIGAAMTAAFLLIRALDVYGDPRPWRQRPPQPAVSAAAPTPPPAATPAPQQRPAAPAAIRFLNTAKYPASLAFLLMTLGPLLLLLGSVDQMRGRVATLLETFGRVPFFYYLLHIPLIHLAACVVSLIRTGSVTPWLFTNHPVAPGDLPENYRWSLALLYLVFVVCVAALYFPCRWYARVRATSKNRWLSYL